MSNEIINIPQTEIVLYQPNESTRLEVRLEDETVWLTQAQMIALFNSSKANISEHISNIYKQGELMQESTVRKFRTVRKEGNRMVSRELDFYNLDMIISVGFRVNSAQGIRFRQWANGVLKQYLLRGYNISQQFLQLERRIDDRLMQQHDEIQEIKAVQQEQQDQLDFFIPFDKLRVNSPTYMAYTYILRLANGQYYVGSTINLTNRIQEHNKGCDKFTRNHLPADLVYYEEYQTQEEAWKREKQLHKWSRVKKEKLINGEWTKQ